ncbi:MAG: M20/M25/M40 family metallo-hydrolase, partial [Planctomycetales bacterium]|nr:M20/M25/M40 family metallo-hydrolase [Planctomycetales bacterium]
MSHLEDFLTANRVAFEQDLFDLLKIPSVSADPAHRDDVSRAAAWLAEKLTSIGLAVETIQTPGAPLIYAESPHVSNAPTVLVYGHYDVQPPDPLNEWISPAFEPTVRDGNVFARGATDDKGQMLTHVMSAW